MQRNAAFLLAASIMVSGCVTKSFGKLQPLSPQETASFTCADIERELAAVEAFPQQVREEAKVNAASVLATAVDFGAGNAVARNVADSSADRRQTDLQALSTQKGCAGAVAAGQTTQPAPAGTQ